MEPNAEVIARPECSGKATRHGATWPSHRACGALYHCVCLLFLHQLTLHAYAPNNQASCFLEFMFFQWEHHWQFR